MTKTRTEVLETRSLEEVQRQKHATFDPIEQQDYLRAKEEVELRTNIAELVYEARVRAGLTQVELAELAHTSQSVVSSIENGSQLPQISTLFRIAEALDAPLEVRIGKSSYVSRAVAS